MILCAVDVCSDVLVASELSWAGEGVEAVKGTVAAGREREGEGVPTTPAAAAAAARVRGRGGEGLLIVELFRLITLL